MTEIQSATELHLDLCPERTAHLLEALVVIKENFHMVDEILSAGLKNICSRISRENGDSAENVDSLAAHDGHTDEEATDGTTKGNDQEEKEKHRQCCCMCTLRINSTKKLQLMTKSSTSGVVKSSIIIDPRLSSKKRTGKPRLNRTASLRRESAAERRASQVQATVIPTPR